jgi:hypothetical protein
MVLNASLRMLVPDPAPDEVTSRYLRQSNHYTASTGRVKPHAFHPAPADYKTSVFRVPGLTEHEIWELGDTHVGSALRARAELSVAQIMDVGLQVEPQEPPQRHANIVGWPVEKAAMMSRAQELAAVATLRLRVVHTGV